MSRALVIVLLGAGCMNEDRFREEADRAVCEWQADCFGYQEQEACVEAARRTWEPVPDTCLFVRDEARDCSDGLRDLECPADGAEPVMPSSCDRVWDCE